MCDDLISFTNGMLCNKTFNCAKCECLLKLPITVVENVGNVCGDCVNKHSLQGIQNKTLESILNELKFPCKFNEKGCQEYIKFADLEEHERCCKFLTKLCLVWNRGRCDWEGTQNELPNHFIENHSELVLNNSYNLFTIKLNLVDNIDAITMLKYKKECYFFKIKKSNDSNLLLYSMCSTKDGQYDSECKIKHVGENGNSVETKCKSTSMNNINSGGYSTTMDLNALKLVTKATKNLQVLVELPVTIDTNKLDEKMMQFFECPVCKNLMKPPIFQCKFGHSFCNTCRPKLDKCPTCRGVFGITRNYSLEGLTSCIPHSCVYHHLGCEEIFSVDDAEKHENNCIYRPYKCPLNECTHEGNHSTIIFHLKQHHPGKIFNAPFYKTTSEYRIGHTMDFFNTCQINFMIFDGNIFRFTFKRNTDYSYWAMEVLRKHDENSTYVYEIGIIDMLREERKLIRTDLVFGEIRSEDLFKKCILFPNSVIGSYANNGMFKHYCRIIRQ